MVLAVTLMVPLSVTYAYVGTSNITAASVNDARVDPSGSVSWTVGPILNGTVNPIQNGWGMDFDAVGDQVACGNDASLRLDGNISILVWIRSFDISTTQRIVSKDQEYMIRRVGNNIVANIWNEGASTWRSSSSTLTSTNWHLVTQTWNNKTGLLSLYINETLVDSDTYTYDPNLGFGNLYIGSSGSGQYFNGTIDEVLIFNRFLGSGEVAYFYNNKVPLNQDGLVAWIDFDQNVQDQSPNGNDGTIGGNPVYVRGIRGKAALTFDETGDNIQVSDDNTLDIDSDITIEAWINAIEWESNRIIEKLNAYKMYVEANGVIRLGLSGVVGTDFTSGNGAISLNTLQHIITTRNRTSGDVRFYVDGSLFQTVNGGLDAIGVNANDLYIADRQAGDRTYNGTIDELRIYNRTLSPDEVAEHYQGIYSNESGLVLYLDFDNNVNDHSGEGNNGGVNGDPEYSDGWANCPVSTSYNGTLGTTVELVNSTTGLCTIPDTAPATRGNYTVTASVPAASANATYLGFIVDSYHVNVYSIYDITEESFNTLLYADGESLVDGHQLTNGDSITIEGVVFSWNTYTSRFEATDSESTPQTKTYDTLTSLNEATYGITNGSMNITATVTWTQGTMDRIQTDFTSGDWVSAIIGEYTYAMGELFFWTTLMTILSIGIYNVWGAYPTILAWILGWGVFTDVIHAQAQIIGYIFILIAVALAIVKLALDRRTT